MYIKYNVNECVRETLSTWKLSFAYTQHIYCSNTLWSYYKKFARLANLNPWTLDSIHKLLPTEISYHDINFNSHLTIYSCSSLNLYSVLVLFRPLPPSIVTLASIKNLHVCKYLKCVGIYLKYPLRYFWKSCSGEYHSNAP